MDIVLGIILLVAAVFLIAAILLQDGKAQVSGAVAGAAADTFFGKNKGSTMDKMLSKITTIVAICFCLIVVAMYVFQEDTDFSNMISAEIGGTSVETVEGDTEAADVIETVEE